MCFFIVACRGLLVACARTDRERKFLYEKTCDFDNADPQPNKNGLNEAFTICAILQSDAGTNTLVYNGVVERHFHQITN
jgi:hypothetical protein